MNQSNTALGQCSSGLDEEARSLALRLGRRIGLLRVASGLSKTELGLRLGVRRQMIDRYENGFDLPRLNVALRLCAALRLDPNELLAGLLEPPVPALSPAAPVARTEPSFAGGRGR